MMLKALVLVFALAIVVNASSFTISSNSTLVSDGDWVTVSFAGFEDDVSDRADCWIGLYAPSTANTSSMPKPTYKVYEPIDDVTGESLGDTWTKPWTVDAPVKFISCAEADADFMNTGHGSKSFHLLNMRTSAIFVLFKGGYDYPVTLAKSQAISFKNPNKPMHVHLALGHYEGSVVVQWVMLKPDTAWVEYGWQSGKYTEKALSAPITYSHFDLCGSPANSTGWFEPGFFHRANIVNIPYTTPLQPIYYRVGNTQYGFSEEHSFYPPAPANPKLPVHILLTADVGATEPDGSHYHWEEPDASTTIQGLIQRYHNFSKPNGWNSVLTHIGDLAYATGYESKWELFMNEIEPIASIVPYMVAQGNHERDWPGTGTEWVGGEDSGGECGLPTQARFQMPTPSRKDESMWYSFEQGPVHFVMMETELPCHQGSTQYTWIQQDLEAVDRTKTPWVIFAGHRPMYTGDHEGSNFAQLEPLLMQNKVDLALWGHVHNAQLTCPVFNQTCISANTTGAYDAPIHAVIGNGGQSLSAFPEHRADWSVYQSKEWGWNEILVPNATHLTINFYTEKSVLDYSHTIVRNYPRN